MTTRADRLQLREEVHDEYIVNSDFRGDQLTPAVYDVLAREEVAETRRLATRADASARLAELLAFARTLPAPVADPALTWEDVEDAWRAQEDALVALAAESTAAYLLDGPRPRVIPSADGMVIFEAIRAFCNGPHWRQLSLLLRAKESGRTPATRSLAGWADRLEALLPLTTPDALASFAALATHGFLERYNAAGAHENAISERETREEEAEVAAWRAAHPEEAKRQDEARARQFGRFFDGLLARDVQ